MIKNPIILKEAKSRARGIKAYIPISIYLILLSIVVYITFLVIYILAGEWGFFLTYDAEYGRDLFTALSFIQLLLILVISSAFNVGSITQEIEHKTYKFLKVTPLSPFEIMFGKIVATLQYVLLLIVTPLPIVFLISVLGGISYLEIIKIYVIIFSYTISISSFAFYFSTIYSKTVIAVSVFYFTLLLYLSLSLILLSFLIFDLEISTPLYLINPFWAIYTQFSFTDFVEIFNIKIPVYIGSIIINFFFTFYILSLAYERIYNQEGYKLIWTRLSFILLFLFLIFYLSGSFHLLFLKVQKYIYFIFSTGLLALLIFSIQSFAIGNFQSDEINLTPAKFLQKLFTIKDIFKNKVTSSVLYLLLLTFLSLINLFILSKIIEFKIFSILPLILIFITTTIFWTMLSFLLNFLFKGKYLARGIFFLIFALIVLGIFIPGMPHCLIFKESIKSIIGYIFLYLNPGIAILFLTDPKNEFLKPIMLNAHSFIINFVILQIFLSALFLCLVIFLQKRYKIE